MTLQTDLETAVAKVQTDSGLLHDIVHGAAATTVTTEGGDVKSVAKLEADIQADLEANNVIGQVTTLRDQAQIAKDDAQAAQSLAEAAAASGMFKVSADDTTGGTLEEKLLIDGSLSVSTQNGGGNETRTLGVRAKSGGGIVIDGDGISVDPGFASDQLARDLALTAYVKADIQASDPAGVYGNVISDNFISDSLAVKINATYDAAEDHYHNFGGFGPNIMPLMSGYTGGGVTITTSGERSGAYYAWHLFDDSWTTQWDTYASVSQTNCWVEIQLPSPKTVSQIALGKETVNGQPYMPKDFRFEGWNGTSWDVLLAVTGKIDWVEETLNAISFSNVTAYSKYRFFSEASNTSYTAFGKLELYESSPAVDITLRPSATALASANPADVSIYFRVRDLDLVSEDVHRVIKASIDGGTTWATGATTTVGDFGDNEKLIRVDVDVSAQVGDQLLWELATFNSKEQQIKQVAAVPLY